MESVQTTNQKVEPPVGMAKPTSAKKPVILCIDDEKMLLETLERLIWRHLGREFDVETADSGEEAVELLEELIAEGRQVALIISDQLMPGIKGDAFLSRAMKLTPHTPKILLTGQADMQAVVNAVNDARLFRFVH
ncbi:MAG: response regulator, partial [Bacteroidia bacterium]|nr:response regulator [Bacteroidia bacterium]